MSAITLAGQVFEIAPPPFGVLRKLISSLNRMSQAAGNSESAMDESANLFALLTGKTVAEIDAMPISMLEVAAALEIVPVICGLVQGDAQGEAQATMDLTVSTAI